MQPDQSTKVVLVNVLFHCPFDVSLYFANRQVLCSIFTCYCFYHQTPSACFLHERYPPATVSAIMKHVSFSLPYFFSFIYLYSVTWSSKRLRIGKASWALAYAVKNINNSPLRHSRQSALSPSHRKFKSSMEATIAVLDLLPLWLKCCSRFHRIPHKYSVLSC